MSSTTIIILAIAIAIIINYAIENYKKSKKRKMEIALKIKALKALYPQIVESVANFPSSKYPEMYFNMKRLNTWIELNTVLYNTVKSNYIEPELKDIQMKQVINSFIFSFTNGNVSRNTFNTNFIISEKSKYKDLFDNIEGRSLDDQQRTAIIKDEDHNLVIAGAGSGKTSTIIGKIMYLVTKFNLFSSEILLISFTKKSVKDLEERLQGFKFKAHTFHAFAFSIVSKHQNYPPDVLDPNEYPILIKNIYKDLSNNFEFKNDLADFYINKLKPYKSQFEFNNQGQYIQYIKDHNFRPYILSINDNIVKSIEECIVANYLTFHNIKFIYEAPHPADATPENYRRYRPDFKIIQGDKTIYLEHFGIDRNGNVPDWFQATHLESATEKYTEGMEWKREFHKKHNTILIETYSYQFKEKTVLSHLSQQLIKNGIIPIKMSSDEILALIEAANSQEISSFIETIATFISLLKANNVDFNEIKKMVSSSTLTPDEKVRNSTLLQIIEKVFTKYQDHLEQSKKIDFNDLINKACDIISTDNYSSSFKYIIIDEFQDISFGRYKLIKSLLTQNQATKLFCVGDDWQSIYRFAGSDLGLFSEFQNYFGHTEISYIETTYRYGDPLLKLSGDFILKNPNQSKKTLKPFTANSSTYFRFVYSESALKDIVPVKSIFDEFLQDPNYNPESKIRILGRYSFDINRLISEDSPIRILPDGGVLYNCIETGKSLTASFMTAHKSKGLEADYVLILNCNAGKFGFPSELSDDPVLSLVLSGSDVFANGEERRLFYVAMTRAKKGVYFISNMYEKSKFIVEIDNSGSNIKCPICKTADLVVKSRGTNPTRGPFNYYGCTNYSYGCNYSRTIFTATNPH